MLSGTVDITTQFTTHQFTVLRRIPLRVVLQLCTKDELIEYLLWNHQHTKVQC